MMPGQNFFYVFLFLPLIMMISKSHAWDLGVNLQGDVVLRPTTTGETVVKEFAAAGIRNGRIDMRWCWIAGNSRQSPLQWQKIDRLVVESSKLGIELVAILFCSPHWTNNYAGYDTPQGRVSRAGFDYTVDNTWAKIVPDNLQEWEIYVDTAVRRFSGTCYVDTLGGPCLGPNPQRIRLPRITYWTPLNEGDTKYELIDASAQSFFENPASPTSPLKMSPPQLPEYTSMQTYIRVYSAAARSIRHIPGNKIVGADFASTRGNHFRDSLDTFLNWALPADALDVLGLHIYPEVLKGQGGWVVQNVLEAEVMPILQKYQKKFNRRLPLWITETGFNQAEARFVSGRTGDYPLYQLITNQWESEKWQWSQTLSVLFDPGASHQRRRYEAFGVEKIFFYSAVDSSMSTPDFGVFSDTSGSILKPKLTFDLLKKFATKNPCPVGGNLAPVNGKSFCVLQRLTPPMLQKQEVSNCLNLSSSSQQSSCKTTTGKMTKSSVRPPTNMNYINYGPSYFPDVEYWIEKNSNYPGIYYPKYAQDCLFGGVVSGNSCLVRDWNWDMRYSDQPLLNSRDRLSISLGGSKIFRGSKSMSLEQTFPYVTVSDKFHSYEGYWPLSY